MFESPDSTEGLNRSGKACLWCGMHIEIRSLEQHAKVWSQAWRKGDIPVSSWNKAMACLQGWLVATEPLILGVWSEFELLYNMLCRFLSLDI